MTHHCKLLASTDLTSFKELLKLFGEVFEEAETYQHNVPNDKYLEEFLKYDNHVILVAFNEKSEVVGGLVGYVLKKFEKIRNELYVYDLAVSNDYQRQGVGTVLFEKLKQVAKMKKVSTVFVQADKEDTGAIAFYRTLSTEEIQCYHFDIEIER